MRETGQRSGLATVSVAWRAVPYQLAALGAAALWAASSLIAAEPARRLGGPRFTRLRMLWVCLALTTITAFTGGWRTLDLSDIGLVAISGIVGLLIGDIALFTAMAQIGPRRTSVLFTSNAPLAAIGGVWFFGETFTRSSLFGAALTIVGISLAIVYGTARGDSHAFESIEGSMRSGVIWAAIGAIGQAGGALVAKPVLDAGADTIAVATCRALIATAAMWIFAKATDEFVKPPGRGEITRRDVGIIVASGTIAMVIGMTLLLYALGNGDAGVTTILSATTPVMLLPALWAVTRRPPPVGAWIGAALTVVGTALLV